MNNNLYQNNPVFLERQMSPTQPTTPPIPQQFIPAGTEVVPTSTVPIEEQQSYIENILRQNRGKIITAYMSFTDSNEWRDKAFTGVLEDAGIDHIIISDPKTGTWYLLKSIYLDYVSSEEKLNFVIIAPKRY
jgi:spore germination protein Q